MKQSKLSDFISENIEPILQEWEDFARTIEPPALTMDDVELRDHAKQMLQAFAEDLMTHQSEHEGVAKSRGLGKRGPDDTAAEVHAEARLLSGYTVVQLVSEYRALRSSVLKLWANAICGNPSEHLHDITRFNEAVDQALAESIARYEYMVKQSQNMFLAILGHDLRNPLGTVVTGSSFLMQATDIPPKYVLVATRMFNSAKRMSKLINDLIDFTRTHLGPGIPVRVKQGSLVALCEEVVNEARTFHPDRLIDLKVPHILDAIFDEGRIAQVLSNLIGNAIQYGTAETPIVVCLKKCDENIVLSVNNQGKTIDVDKVQTIFDPMVRIAANSNVSEKDFAERTSLGIGLYIAREIVKAHGGDIMVSSNNSDGTTFSVIMPRLPAGFSGEDSSLASMRSLILKSI
jgi:signal transduction histidine kinase